MERVTGRYYFPENAPCRPQATSEDCRNRIEKLEAENLKLQREVEADKLQRDNEFDDAYASYIKGLTRNAESVTVDDGSREKSRWMLEEAKDRSKWAALKLQLQEENRLKAKVFTLERTIRLIRAIWGDALDNRDLPDIPDMLIQPGVESEAEKLIETIMRQRAEDREREITPHKDFSKLNKHELQSVYDEDEYIQEAMKNYPFNFEDRSQAALLKLANLMGIGRSPFELMIKGDRMNTLLHLKNPIALHVSLAERSEICKENETELNKRLELGNMFLDGLLSKYGHGGTRTLPRKKYDFLITYMGERTRRLVEQEHGKSSEALYKQRADRVHAFLVNQYDKLREVLYTSAEDDTRSDMEIRESFNKHVLELKDSISPLETAYANVTQAFETHGEDLVMKLRECHDNSHSLAEEAENKFYALEEEIKVHRASVQETLETSIEGPLQDRAVLRKEMKALFEKYKHPRASTVDKTRFLDGIFDIYEKKYKASESRFVDFESRFRSLMVRHEQYLKRCTGLSTQLENLDKHATETEAMSTTQATRKQEDEAKAIKIRQVEKKTVNKKFMFAAALATGAVFHNNVPPVPPGTEFAVLSRIENGAISMGLAKSYAQAVTGYRTVHNELMKTQNTLDEIHKMQNQMVVRGCSNSASHIHEVEEKIEEYRPLVVLANSAGSKIEKTGAIQILAEEKAKSEVEQGKRFGELVKVDQKFKIMGHMVNKLDEQNGDYFDKFDSGMEKAIVASNNVAAGNEQYAKEQTGLRLQLETLSHEGLDGDDLKRKIALSNESQASRFKKYEDILNETPYFNPEETIGQLDMIRNMQGVEKTSVMTLQGVYNSIIRNIEAIERALQEVTGENGKKRAELQKRLSHAQSFARECEECLRERDIAAGQHKAPVVVQIQKIRQRKRLISKKIRKTQLKGESLAHKALVARDITELCMEKTSSAVSQKLVFESNIAVFAGVEGQTEQAGEIIKGLQKQLGLAKNELENLKETSTIELEKLQKQFTDTMQELEDLCDNQVSSKATLGTLAITLGEKEKEASSLDEGIGNIKSANSTEETAESNRIRAELLELTEARRVLGVEITALREELKDLTTKISKIEQEIHDKTVIVHDAQEQIDAKEKAAFCGGKCPLLEKCTKLQAMVNSLTESDPDRKEVAVDALKILEQEQVSKQIELTKIKEHRIETVQALKNKIQGWKDKAEASIIMAESYKSRFILEKRNSSFLMQQLSDTSAQLRAAQELAEKRKIEKQQLSHTIREHDITISELNNELSQERANLEAAEKAKKDATDDLKGLQESYQKMIIAGVAKDAELEGLKGNLTEMLGKYNVVSSELEKKKKEYEAQTLVLEAKEKKLEELKTEVDTKAAEITAKQNTVAELEKDIEELTESRRLDGVDLDLFRTQARNLEVAVQQYIEANTEATRSILIRQLEFELQRHIVVAEGELQRRTFEVVGEARTVVSNILEQGRDGVLALRQKIMTIEGDITSKDKEIADLKAIEEKTAKEIETLRDNATTHATEKAKLEQDLQRERTENIALTEQKEKLEREVNTYIPYVPDTRATDELQTMIRQKDAELKKLRTQYDDILNNLSAKQLELDGERTLRTHEVEQLKEGSETKLSELIAQHITESERLQKEIDDNTAHKSKLENDIDQLHEHCDVIEGFLSDEIALREELEAKLGDLERDSTITKRLTSAYVASRTKSNGLETQLALQRARLTLYEEQSVKREGTIKGLKEKMEVSRRNEQRAKNQMKKFIKDTMDILEREEPGHSHDGATMTIDTAATILADIEKRKVREELTAVHREQMQLQRNNYLELRTMMKRCQTLLGASSGKYGTTLRETTLAQQSQESIEAKKKEHMRQTETVLAYSPRDDSLPIAIKRRGEGIGPENKRHHVEEDEDEGDA